MIEKRRQRLVVLTRTHIIDGRVPNALLLEVLTDQGVGIGVRAHAVPSGAAGSEQAPDTGSHVPATWH